MSKLTLRQARRMREISQAKMAEMLDVHVNTYRTMEEEPGEISVNQAKRICEILNVTVDDIFFK